MVSLHLHIVGVVSVCSAVRHVRNLSHSQQPRDPFTHLRAVTQPLKVAHTQVRRTTPSALSSRAVPKMHLHPNMTFRSPSISAALEQLESHMQLKNQRLVTSYLLLEIDCKVLESKHFMFAQCLVQQKPCR